MSAPGRVAQVVPGRRSTLQRTTADWVLPLDCISSLVGVSHQIRPNQPLME